MEGGGGVTWIREVSIDRGLWFISKSATIFPVDHITYIYTIYQ